MKLIIISTLIIAFIYTYPAKAECGYTPEAEVIKANLEAI